MDGGKKISHHQMMILLKVIETYKILLPAWVPVIFATITPIGFAVNATFTRYLHLERKFNPSTLQFSSAFVMNCLLLTIAGIFWN